MAVRRMPVWALSFALFLTGLLAEPQAKDSPPELSLPEGYVWHEPEAVAQVEGEVTDAHVTCDEEGAVHLVWIAERQSIHCAVRTDEGWQPAETVAESKTRRTKLAAARVAARGGEVWVVHRRDLRSGRSEIVASRRTPEGWGEPETLSESKVTLLPPTVHIDADGQPQVYWFVLIPPPSIVRNVEHELYVRRHGPEGWGAETKVLEPTVNITSPTIEFNRQDQVHMAWFVLFREAGTGVKDLTTPQHYSFIHRMTSGQAGALRPSSRGPFIIMAPGQATLVATIDRDGYWHGLARAHPVFIGKQQDQFFHITNRGGAWPTDVKPVAIRPGRSTGTLLAGSLGERGVLLAWQEGTTLHGFLVEDGEQKPEWSVPIEGEAVSGAGAEDGRFHLVATQTGRRGKKWIAELLYYRLSPADTSEGASAQTPAQ